MLNSSRSPDEFIRPQQTLLQPGSSQVHGTGPGYRLDAGEKLMRRVFEILAVLCVLLTLPAASVISKEPNEEATKAALVKIAGEGLVESHAYEYLTQLSDDVGARVTGSPQSQKAVDWSLSKMRAIGLENVHAEKFRIWRGWTRGTAQAELTGPIQRRLNVDAMGWTGATPASGAGGDLVAANVFNLEI